MTPEHELLERCKKDDRKAHHQLYLVSFSFLLSVCRRYYVNEEDRMSALNLIFVKMVKNISAYIKKKENIPFDLWTRRIAINHIVDEYRKNKNYRESFDFIDVGEAEHIHPLAHPSFEKENLEEIRNAIERLPAMNRAVFNLFVVDGYRHEEIGKMLNISPNTSKVHLHKAKKKLKEFLENEWKKKPLIENTILQ